MELNYNFQKNNFKILQILSRKLGQHFIKFININKVEVINYM